VSRYRSVSDAGQEDTQPSICHAASSPSPFHFLLLPSPPDRRFAVICCFVCASPRYFRCRAIPDKAPVHRLCRHGGRSYAHRCRQQPPAVSATFFDSRHALFSSDADVMTPRCRATATRRPPRHMPPSLQRAFAPPCDFSARRAFHIC